MDNIYGQDELRRNSVTELPEGFAENAGDTLYSWLGSLWRSIHLGDKMVRGLQRARGMRLAQLYLDILEAAQLKDRYGAPVFHRELWHPIVIRRSDRDKAQENMLDMGDGAEIGPQTSPDSKYGHGTVLQMGKLANYKDYVTYPIREGIVAMSASIVDNIVNPSVVIKCDTGDGEGGFSFRNNSIVFRKEDDPLSAGSPFEKYDVPGLNPDNPEESDVEAVLWASDVLFDRNYLAEHLSYPLGADAPSSDIVKRILNAAWSSVASGLTPELMRTLAAAMLNIPVVQGAAETVENIVVNDDCQEVHTDLGVYRVSKKARLLDTVRSGAVLRRGDLLDESLRIYPLLNSAIPNGTKTGFSVPMEQDIPSVVLSSDILGAKTEYGVYAMWDEAKVMRSEESPGQESYPHLYFDIGGEKPDRDAFWSEVWERAEALGVNLKDIIGDEGSTMRPAEFFMRNFVGANTMFVVVDGSQLDDASLMRDPMFFGMLTSVVPSAMRLFLVEHRPVVDEMEPLDNAGESTSLAAALPGRSEHMSEGSLPGIEGGGASFGDRIMMRFIRPAPAKKRARKEEE